MITLQLSDTEAEVLKAALQHFLIELEREISHTDSREFKKDLEKTEQLLREVTDHLEKAA
jgi:hypothetical protein